jgi:hypothetical protein
MTKKIEVTTELIDELRAKTKLATQGQWSWEDSPPTLYAGRLKFEPEEFSKYGFSGTHGMNLLGRLDLDWNGKNNLDFIASTGPEIITALLDKIEELEKK